MNTKFIEQAKRLQGLEMTFTVFSQAIKTPFITCDEESFNDQVWIFVTEEQAKEFCKKRLEENQDILMVVKMENNQLLPFYSSLYFLGVNELVFTEEERTTKMPLEDLVREPDYSKLPKEQRPLLNPQMQLTGIYFMQELHRRKPNKEKPKLRELEEEMAVNLVRSRFLVALEVEGDQIEKGAKNVRIPCVKNSEGKMFQPIFTDAREFGRFNKDKNFKASVVEFGNIKKIINDNVEGIVVNPQTLNIVIMKDRIPVLLNQFAAKKED